MIFNGQDLSDVLNILSIKKPFLPEVLSNDMRISGQDGLYVTGKSEFKEMYIDVKVELKNNTQSTKELFFRNVAKMLFSDVEKKLIFKREPNVYYMAKLDGNTDFERIYEYGLTTLTFKATRPFSYSLDKTTKPLNTPFVNVGTYKSYGIVTVTAPTANNLTISNGEKTLKLLYPFTGTQKIIVDLEKQYVTMNGNNAMKYISLESDFFTIPSGNANITSNGTGTVEYQERWL